MQSGATITDNVFKQEIVELLVKAVVLLGFVHADIQIYIITNKLAWLQSAEPIICILFIILFALSLRNNDEYIEDVLQVYHTRYMF